MNFVGGKKRIERRIERKEKKNQYCSKLIFYPGYCRGLLLCTLQNERSIAGGFYYVRCNKLFCRGQLICTLQ